MKKILGYVITAVVTLVVSVGAMFMLMKFYPNEIVKTITEKNVNVTDTGISESVNKVKDSVVVIETYTKGSLVGTGTGFVYDKDDKNGYIMTNHHVIESGDTIKITYSNDSETTATVVGSDEFADIAVLKVDKDTVLSTATIGKSSDISVGDTVFTIGSPMGIEYKGTVTKGILSGKDRLVSVSVGNSNSADWIMNVMQTDAAINPGNSGGPLCNANGEVIGINSMKIVQTTIEGIGFAIPIEDAVMYAESLRENGKINRPYVGVSMINASNTMQLLYSGIRLDKDITEGVVVVDVEKSSPASKAGIKSEDVIVKVGNDKVASVAEFRYRLYSYEVGDTVELTSAVKSFILNDTVQVSSRSTFERFKSFVFSSNDDTILFSLFSFLFEQSILSNLYPSVGTMLINFVLPFSIKNF